MKHTKSMIYRPSVESEELLLYTRNTSGNLEIQIRTYQTHFENVYYNLIVFDYNTKTEYEVGYIYTKRNNGTIGLWDGYAIYKMIEAGNEITTDIFKKYA